MGRVPLPSARLLPLRQVPRRPAVPLHEGEGEEQLCGRRRVQGGQTQQGVSEAVQAKKPQGLEAVLIRSVRLFKPISCPLNRKNIL